MRPTEEHALVPTLKRQLVERQIDRREFVRYATLLGMAAPAAYAFAAKVTGAPLVAPAAAQGTLPKGGTLAHRHALPGPQESPHLQLGRVVQLRASGSRLPGRDGSGQRHPPRASSRSGSRAPISRRGRSACVGASSGITGASSPPTT
jgi:hypothetical protein